jgi:radical SAM superfamily enzyme YgiQ (UPF0313 family)
MDLLLKSNWDGNNIKGIHPSAGRRILLILPNQKWCGENVTWHLHPYPLAIIAAMIDRDKYEVRILDANIDDMTPEDVRREIRAWKPNLVGASVLANEFGSTGHIALECAKSVSADIVTVMGGVYPTTRSRDAVMDENVDWVVIGEGESTFPALLEHLWGGGQLPGQGLGYMKNGVCVLQERHLVPDVNCLPYPAFDLIDFNRYAHESYKNVVDSPRAFPYGKIITSRGCPIGCTFCQVESISGKFTRFQSAERVLDELEWLVEVYGIKAIEFVDDNLLGHRTRSFEIFRGMKERKIPLVWNAMNVSSFFLTEELLEAMREAGCQYVSIAVESGVKRVLKDIIKKPIDLEHCKRMVNKARSLGMDTTSLWVIGSPGETWNEIRETIRVAEWMGTDYTKINVATPYPGTELFDMAVAGGYLSEDFSFDDLSWGQATINTEEFSSEELTLLRAFEWDRINFSKAEKREKIMQMMQVSGGQLDEIRRATRRNSFQGGARAYVGKDNATEIIRVAPQNVGDITLVANADLA